jgi:hypothetical protein
MPTTAAISCYIEEVGISRDSFHYKCFSSGSNFFSNIIFHFSMESATTQPAD